MPNVADSQRLSGAKPMPPSVARRELRAFSSQQFGLGPITVDIGALKLLYGDTGKRVTPKAMSVLIELALRPMETVARDELLEAVWPDTCPGPEVLTQAIKELRKALGDDQKAPEFIETVPKIGYRLLQLPLWQNTPIVPAREVSVSHAAPPAQQPAKTTASQARRYTRIAGFVVVIALAMWLARGDESRTSAPTAQSRSAIRMLTSAPGAEWHPVISPDGRWFAYTRSVVGHNRIFLRERAGSEARLLNSASEFSELSPRFSPDGSEIAFMRFGRATGQTEAEERCEIIARGVAAASQRKLADCLPSPMFSFDWPAPQELLVSQRANADQGVSIHRLNLGDGKLTQLGTATAAHSVDWQPRLSPDGKKLVFQRGMGSDAVLILANADGGEPQVLAQLTTPLSGFDWLADSSGVLAASARDDRIELQQWRLSQPPTYTGIEGAYPSISRGGEVLFNVMREQTQLLDARLTDVAATHPVFASTGVDAAPCLSPDGRHLAFISTRGGMSQLWLGELGHTPHALSTQRGNFSAPQWHPSGTLFLASQTRANEPDAVLLEYDVARSQLREIAPPAGLGLIVRTSYDGDGLLVLSSKNGQRTLRRYLLTTTQIVNATPAQPWAVDYTLENVAGFQRDDVDGQLYFTQLGDSALYRREPGGAQTRVMPHLPTGNIYWAWRVHAQTIYYLESNAQITSLWAQSLTTGDGPSKARQLNASAELGDFSLNVHTGQLILVVTTADDTDIAWLPAL